VQCFVKEIHFCRVLTSLIKHLAFCICLHLFLLRAFCLGACLYFLLSVYFCIFVQYSNIHIFYILWHCVYTLDFFLYLFWKQLLGLINAGF